jgi:hypothetical protein
MADSRPPRRESRSDEGCHAMSHRLWLVVDKDVRAAEYELDAQVWHNQAPTTGEQVDGPRVFAGAPGEAVQQPDGLSSIGVPDLHAQPRQSSPPEPES